MTNDEIYRNPEEVEIELDVDVVKKAMDDLTKHFDTVQIFATRESSSNTTVDVKMGKGNFYARYGLARLWVDEVRLTDPEGNDDD